MPSFPAMLAPLHRKLILRHLTLGALIAIGIASLVQLSFSIHALFAHAPNSFSLPTLLLSTSLGLFIAWITRPSLFQTAHRLDQSNNTADLFSSSLHIAQAHPKAIKIPHDPQFTLALNALAVQTLRKIKPEPFILFKRLAPPVILLMTISFALSLWPTSPKSPSPFASSASIHSSEKINPSPTLFHPAKNPAMPDPASDSPSNSLFAPQPQPGQGYTSSDPTNPNPVAPGAIPHIKPVAGNAQGFPTLSPQTSPKSWQGNPNSSTGHFNQENHAPTQYNDVLTRYFSPQGL